MLRPENMLDIFVKRLKACEEFRGVRFVHARKPSEPEKPVESFFVACSVGAVHKEKDIKGNRKFEAILEFHIYAPYNCGARKLSALAVALMERVDRGDTDCSIADIRISDPVYDKNICTLCQKVQVQILWEIVPETPEKLPESLTVPVVVNGVSVQVISATSQVQEEVYVLRELLWGETDRYISKGLRYKVNITVEAANDPFENMGIFNITFDCGNAAHTFVNSRVTSITERKNSQNVPVREYEFFTRKLIREENGVKDE